MERQELIRDFIYKKILNGRSQASLDFDTNLLRSGLIDSVAMLKMVSFIEETFRIKVPFEDFTVQNFRSINVVVDYLDRRQA